jgi:hypothetical protein
MTMSILKLNENDTQQNDLNITSVGISTLSTMTLRTMTLSIMPQDNDIPQWHRIMTYHNDNEESDT